MNKQYNKTDIENILRKYNLGKFKKFGKILKNDRVSFCQVIHTSKKKVFMKVFRIFGTHIKQGLIVASYMEKKGFPTYETYQSKQNKSYIIYKKIPIALLEYINIRARDDWPVINNSQMKSYSQGLARFHIDTKNLNLKKIPHGNFKDIKKRIKIFYKIREKKNKKIQKILEFMKENISNTKCPNKEYKSGYYSEYNPGHVFFSGSKIKYVIDWAIGYDNAYYDFGSSMVACFSKNGKKLNYMKLRTYIYEYNKIRKLSSSEKEHIYEALLFGICKYGVWGLNDLKKGKIASDKEICKDGVNRVLFIMNLSKKEFDLRLNIKS
ncbi:hypothetical protein GOV12_04095 [Candidatus Pacearchaeota archaeon]|nr:hypothetical protein [Candidatus Pacearchaeota archaeon]